MLKILVIGAHPDDPEGVAGLTVKWIRKGHTVKYLSATDGGAGHHVHSPAETVEIRRKEAGAVKKYLGLYDYEFLDIPDGELVPDLKNRKIMMKSIREFEPDVIITNRPNDYHPDHRAASQLVADCSYLIAVPSFLPEVPSKRKLPVIFYMGDTIKTPAPFIPTVIFDIEDVIAEKLHVYTLHVSQFFEWLPWVGGIDTETIPNGINERSQWLFEWRSIRWKNHCDAFRKELTDKYGEEKGNNIKYCEALEACEYGGNHSKEFYNMLFDFD